MLRRPRPSPSVSRKSKFGPFESEKLRKLLQNKSWLINEESLILNNLVYTLEIQDENGNVSKFTFSIAQAVSSRQMLFSCRQRCEYLVKMGSGGYGQDEGLCITSICTLAMEKLLNDYSEMVITNNLSSSSQRMKIDGNVVPNGLLHSIQESLQTSYKEILENI